MKTFKEYLDKMGHSWNDFDRTYEMENLIEQYADEKVKKALTIPDVSNALPIGTKVVYEGKTMKITNNREEFWGEPAYRCDYKRDELYIMDDFYSIDLGNDC